MYHSVMNLRASAGALVDKGRFIFYQLTHVFFIAGGVLRTFGYLRMLVMRISSTAPDPDQRQGSGESAATLLSSLIPVSFGKYRKSWSWGWPDI